MRSLCSIMLAAWVAAVRRTSMLPRTQRAASAPVSVDKTDALTAAAQAVGKNRDDAPLLPHALGQEKIAADQLPLLGLLLERDFNKSIHSLGLVAGKTCLELCSCFS